MSRSASRSAPISASGPLPDSATDGTGLPEGPPRGVDAFRRAAWQRYRAAARAFALRPEDRKAVEELESASSGLRRAAAVTAWRRA